MWDDEVCGGSDWKGHKNPTLCCTRYLYSTIHIKKKNLKKKDIQFVMVQHLQQTFYDPLEEAAFI